MMNSFSLLSKTRKKTFLAVLALLMGIGQIVLILASWIISSIKPEWGVRSLLSGEGIRWLFGNFTENISGSGMVWLLLTGMAYGAIKYSGLGSVICHLRHLSYRERLGITLVVVEMVIFIVVFALLTLIPHAVLLGITGKLYPGSFSRSIVSSLCFLVCSLSITFGLVADRLRSLVDVLDCLVIGIAYTLPFWLIYILGMELYCSFLFVLL
jgi:hypothetical protein